MHIKHLCIESCAKSYKCGHCKQGGFCWGRAFTSSRLQAALMSSSTASSRGLSSSGEEPLRGLTANRRLSGSGGTLRGDSLAHATQLWSGTGSQQINKAGD